MAKADHIQVRIFKTLGLIVHHGIDLGDGTAIHFYKKGVGTRPIIARTKLSDFGDGLDISVVSGSNIFALADDEVINRAAWLLNNYNNQNYGAYDEFNNNCEHIANWCKSGNFYSGQAETAKSVINDVKNYVKEHKWEIAHMAVTAFKK